MQKKELTTIIFLIFFIITQNGSSQNNLNQLNLIPQPSSVVVHEGCFKINSNTTIKSNNPFCGTYLKEKIEHASKYKINLLSFEKANSNQLQDEENSIVITIVPGLTPNKEGYNLSVNERRITIAASTQAGAFYGIQSLLQLLPPSIYGTPTGFEKWSVPAVEISDSPLFAYRGFMLDVSRTFFDIGVLYNYVDWLSYHKLNKFHLHLADDNGWRIEIKKYPKLTREGAWRGEGEILPATFGSGDKRYGGFYTQKQLKALIKYAAERNIEIIPEIDLPGHSKALAACYPDVLCNTTKEFASVQGETGNVLCIGNENNYKILYNIFKEIAALFPSDYIHIGGDEVNMDNWKACPLCTKLMQERGMTQPEQLQNYFVRRLEIIIEKLGKKMAGWDEIIEGGELNPQTRVYAWRDIKTGLRSAEKGQPTIMQPAQYFYVDMKQSPVERGHNWAAIVTLEKLYSFNTKNLNNNIIGVQAGLWTELLNRPPRFIEYQTFPRLSALAEVGWSDNDKRVWNDFNYRLTKTHYERLYNMGIAFRLPMPDVTYNNNKLKVTLPYDWAIVRYTSDKTEPNQSSSIYCGEITTDSPENYRFATFYGTFDKSITVGANNIELHHYLSPKTTVSTNLLYSSEKQLSNLTDYKFDTYFRSKGKAKAGDYIIYTFEEPVECSSITIETGIPNIDFYGITNGHVEYSYDGNTWLKGDYFYEHRAIIYPSQAVKSVKLSIDGTNDGPTSLCLQDLKIECGEC